MFIEFYTDSDQNFSDSFFFFVKRPRVVPRPTNARAPKLPSSNVPMKTEKTKQDWVQCPNEKRDENNI